VHDWADQLEQLFATGQLQEGRELAGEILAEAADQQSAAVARYHLARIAIRLHEVEAGLEEIRRARVVLEAAASDALVVECLDWEAAALHLMENPAALSTAREALRRCLRLEAPPPTTEARILGRLGAIALSHHDWKSAIWYYEAATQRLEPVRDVRLLAHMCNDLSVAYLELGMHERAIHYARRGLGLHRMLDEGPAVARVTNNLGLALLRSGRLPEAEAQLRRSLRQCRRLQLTAGVSHVLLSIGELEFRRERWTEAEVLFAQAAEMAASAAEPLTQAAANQWLALVNEVRGERDEADRAFLVAMRELTGQGVGDRLRECRASYALVLERRGDAVSAVQHWKEVARDRRAVPPGLGDLLPRFERLVPGRSQPG
jgi:tetratricopeptide (TPR) repeat protein